MRSTMQLLAASRGGGISSALEPKTAEHAKIRVDADQLRCAARAASLIQPLLASTETPQSTLLIDSPVESLPERFRDPKQFRLTCASLEDSLSHRRMAFTDGEFDAVLALDCFDRIPASQRNGFVRECLRVARHGVVFSHPDGRAAVRQAERFVAELFARRFGQPHSQLGSKGREPNPTVEIVSAMLCAADVEFATFGDEPLHEWLNRRLHEDHLPDRPTSANASQSNSAPYRRFHVCARSFDAASALASIERDPDVETEYESTGERFAELAGDLLATLDADLRIERLARDAEHAELRQSSWHWQEKALVFSSFSSAAQASAGWRLGKPLRTIRRWLRPRGFAREALLPWRHVEPIRREPHSWRVNEPGGQFVVPIYLPAGWVRVQMRLRRLDGKPKQAEQAELVFHGSDWAAEPLWREQLTWSDSLGDVLHIDLPEPAFGVRFQPLLGEGKFAIETFSVEPLSPLTVAARAARCKLKLLRDYRCTGTVLTRGLKLLATGQWGQFRRKLFRSLSDVRQMRVEDERAEEVQAAWRRRSLTDQELQRLQSELDAMPAQPPISAVLTVHGTSEAALRLAVESVKRQVYPHWQLIVATTEATPPGARRVLKHFAEDARITVVTGHTGETTARAAALATVKTELVAVLPSGHELAEETFLRLVQQIAVESPSQLVVNASDSDGLTLTGRLSLAYTSDWQIDPTGKSLVQKSSSKTNFLPHPLSRPAACIEPVPLLGTDDVPAVTPPSGPPWVVTGNLVGISGYDYVVFEVVRGLMGLNRDVSLNGGCSIRTELLLPQMAARVRQRKATDRELIVAPPFAISKYSPTKSSVVLTMWESDRLQPNWVQAINRAGLVIVPSQWGAECFRNSGVTAPIEVVPLGCDPLVFHPREAPPEVCTFGTAAALFAGGVRKNTNLLINWFQRAFPDEDDVRLRIKVTPKCDLPESDDPRIEIVRQYLPPTRLADWYRSLTAFVSVSHAEGFGLHLLEAMACGRPVVSAKYSGLTEYFDESVGFPVDHRLVPAECGVYSGRWAEIDEESLIATMRQVYNDSTECARRGALAATRARRFTWKDTGRRLTEVLDAASREAA